MIKLLNIVAWFVICLLSAIFLSSNSSQAAFNDIPQQLPDDYGLYESNTSATYICDGSILGNVDKCPPFGNGKVDDGRHHQYFTIANTNNLNNVKTGERIGGYAETHAIIYTNQRELNQQVGITPVNRGIRTQGGLTDCSGDIRMIVSKPGSSTPVGSSVQQFNTRPETCNAIERFNLRSDLLDNSRESFDNVFSELILYDKNGGRHNTGIYYSYLTIRLQGNTVSGQFSYRLSSDTLRLGIAKNNFVNIYPTALADKHQMRFRWAAPCNQTGSISARTDNLDGNNLNIQSHSPAPFMQRYTGNNPHGSSISIMGKDNYDLSFPLRVAQQPVNHYVMYNNISGGNGIGFRYPEDSANYFLECPGYKWNLSPDTKVSVQAGSYTPSSNWNTSVNRARTAFSQARFTESLNNTSNVAAQSGSVHHSWNVEYRYVRGDTGVSSAVRTKPTNYTAFVNANSRHIFSPPSLVPTNNTTSGIEFLFGAKYRTSSSTATRIPHPNDQYCERLTNSSFNVNEGDISGNPSAWDCVVLNGPRRCLPWSVVSTSNFEQTEGGGSPSVAWVDDVYKFNAAAWNNGPAASTSVPINFKINRVDRGAQVLGRWDSGDDWLSISRDDGGKIFEKIFEYSPTNGDTGCGASGSGQQGPYNVSVPYYYHLPTEMQPIGDKIYQGNAVNVNGKITLPDRDSDVSPRATGDRNDGRKHTYTERDREHQWRVLSFVVNDKAQAISAFGTGTRDSSAPCNTGNGITTFGMAGARDCSVVKSGQHRFDSISPFSDGGDFQVSPTTPVGTVVCFTIAVEKPRDDVGWDIWRYAPPVCTTVVKSPKVHFKYGDVNTGRPRIGVGDCAVNSNAKIQATPAPNVTLVEPNPLERHKYGSWGEYGVFSSGSITAFGSSGSEAGVVDKAKRLTFANTSNPYGNYPYNIKCVPNLMNNFSAQDTISGNTIYPNEYFNESGRNAQSRFVKKGNVSLTQRSTDEFKVKVTIIGSGDWGNDIPLNQGGALLPPKIDVRLDLKDSPISKLKTAEMTSQDRNNPSTTVVEFDASDLSVDGWKGIAKISAKFANNNANWYWFNDRPQMVDRNLFINTMQVQWYKNGVEIANSQAQRAAGLPKVAGEDYEPDPADRCAKEETNPTSWRWWENNMSYGRNILAFPPSESDAKTGGGGGSCYGIQMNASTLPSYDGRFNQQYPPPPLLSSDYDGFNSRNIILYAEKRQAGDCGAAGVEGNLYINLDILYKISGYGKLSEIPRFTLMADCDIVIADTVENVRASLIAGNAIQTCSDVAKSQDRCNRPLKVTGAIQAKKLLLYRTHGADLTNTGSAKTSAETFEYGVDQMMAGYEYGLVNPVLKPTYQRDLPPRY